MSRASRLLPCLIVGALLALAPAAKAQGMQWKSCGQGAAANVSCADYKVPRDYDNPNGAKFTLRVAKSPATDKQHRIGSLFMNFGGPGAPMAIYVEVFGADLFSELNKRFDIIGVDPRGVGESQPSIDCKANQETQGIYSEPFPTPFTANQNQLIDAFNPSWDSGGPGSPIRQSCCSRPSRWEFSARSWCDASCIRCSRSSPTLTTT